MNNQKGVTLIELLISLAIFFMIIGITYSVFISGMKNFDKNHSAIQLRSEADFIMTQFMTHLHPATETLPLASPPSPNQSLIRVQKTDGSEVTLGFDNSTDQALINGDIIHSTDYIVSGTVSYQVDQRIIEITLQVNKRGRTDTKPVQLVNQISLINYNNTTPF